MIEIKREPLLALLYLAALVASVYLVNSGKASLRDVAIFFTAAAIIPAAVQRKRTPSASKKNAAPVAPVVVPIEEEKIPTAFVEVPPKDEQTDKGADGQGSK